MSVALPSTIEVTETDGGVRYRLPRRPLGQARIPALIFIVLGLCFAVIPVFLIGKRPANDWLDVVFNVGAIVGVLLSSATGLFFVGIGVLAIFGRCEIEVGDGELLTFDGIGSLGWRRRRSISKLRRLIVEHHPVTRNGQPIKTGPLAEMAVIKVEFEEGKPLWLAIGYPRTWLAPLAEHLAERCRVSTEPGIVPSARPSIEVALVSVLHSDFVELPEQPRESKVIIEESATGVVLRVPAPGLFGRGGGGCLCCSGIVWCGFLLVGTFALIFGEPDPNNPGNLDIRFGWLILGLLWLVGIGFLVAAVHMGRRQAILAVVNHTLMIMQSGLFRSRRWEWKRDELSDIIAGKSNVSVNDEPVIELQIFPKTGKRVGVLLGRGTDELRWLATVLRRTLRLPNLEIHNSGV